MAKLPTGATTTRTPATTTTPVGPLPQTFRKFRTKPVKAPMVTPTQPTGAKPLRHLSNSRSHQRHRLLPLKMVSLPYSSMFPRTHLSLIGSSRRRPFRIRSISKSLKSTPKSAKGRKESRANTYRRQILKIFPPFSRTFSPPSPSTSREFTHLRRSGSLRAGVIEGGQSWLESTVKISSVPPLSASLTICSFTLAPPSLDVIAEEESSSEESEDEVEGTTAHVILPPTQPLRINVRGIERERFPATKRDRRRVVVNIAGHSQTRKILGGIEEEEAEEAEEVERGVEAKEEVFDVCSSFHGKFR
jgi:hypothetical protein